MNPLANLHVSMDSFFGLPVVDFGALGLLPDLLSLTRNQKEDKQNETEKSRTIVQEDPEELPRVSTVEWRDFVASTPPGQRLLINHRSKHIVSVSVKEGQKLEFSFGTESGDIGFGVDFEGLPVLLSPRSLSLKTPTAQPSTHIPAPRPRQTHGECESDSEDEGNEDEDCIFPTMCGKKSFSRKQNRARGRICNGKDGGLVLNFGSKRSSTKSLPSPPIAMTTHGSSNNASHNTPVVGGKKLPQAPLVGGAPGASARNAPPSVTHLLPVLRKNSEHTLIRGVLESFGEGSIHFIWDNSYSRFTSKTVYFSISYCD